MTASWKTLGEAMEVRNQVQAQITCYLEQQVSGLTGLPCSVQIVGGTGMDVRVLGIWPAGQFDPHRESAPFLLRMEIGHTKSARLPAGWETAYVLQLKCFGMPQERCERLACWPLDGPLNGEQLQLLKTYCGRALAQYEEDQRIHNELSAAAQGRKGNGCRILPAQTGTVTLVLPGLTPAQAQTVVRQLLAEGIVTPRDVDGF
jgi:hypothetical protein